jgi:hypothetical protein
MENDEVFYLPELVRRLPQARGMFVHALKFVKAKPRPALRRGLNAPRPGADAHVAAVGVVYLTLATTGTAAAHPVIELHIFRLGGGARGRRPVASRRVVPAALAPGARRRVAIGLGRLRRGTYMLSASYEDADGTSQTLDADFPAQPAVGALAWVRRG